MKATICEAFTSIQGEGIFVGRKQLFIRFSNCNLECLYCDTPASRLAAPIMADFEAKPFSGLSLWKKNPLSAVTLQRYINSVTAADRTIHSISLTGGEPLLQAEFIGEYLRLHKHGRCFHLETNGTLPGGLAKVIEHIDFVSMDLKTAYFNRRGFTKTQREFLNIASSKAMQVKVVAGSSPDIPSFMKAVRMTAATSRAIPFIIQPETGNPPEPSEIATLQRIASAELEQVLVIPQIHVLLGLR